MSGSASSSSRQRQEPMPAATDDSALDRLIQKLYKPGALYYSATRPYNTLSEKRIRQLSSAIRGKADWMVKMNKAEIRARWTEEAKEQMPELTEKELDYVFDELEYYSSLHTQGSDIRLSSVEQVWISDSLIDKDTEKKVKRYAAKLEDVPDNQKDWHPNSNNQVLNLVHPSLFPIVYKRSMLLDKPMLSPEAALQLESFGTCPGSFDGWRDALNKLSKDEEKEKEDDKKGKHGLYFPDSQGERSHYIDHLTSTKYCWLPTEFLVDMDGTAKITSYINNLHPIRHKEFYPTIANVFGRFIPLLEQIVTDLAHPRSARVNPDVYNWHVTDEHEPSDYEASDYEDRHDQWIESRRFIHPQPEPFVIPDRPTTPYSLRGRKLQAVFKMSNIVLTPENPEYKGGSWHLEAMANERIIATGLYYYDVENITESSLAFKECVDYLLHHDQGDYVGVELGFGLADESNEPQMIQNIGQIEAKNGRCVVFPNVYQHRINGFKLADPTKPGHRKILGFFFIDPSTRIPSTEIVPPQQQDWWIETFSDVDSICKLPSLVQDLVHDNVPFPYSLDEAKKT
ncbi:hypothetical protein GGI11_007032, partial [Coemansia sp. RSA 2049]